MSTLISQAVVAEAPGRVAFRTVNSPAPASGDVIVRVTHSWISNGTESSFLRGERISGDVVRSPEDPFPFPHVPGYQKCGVVESVGSQVRSVQPGDRVFASVSRVQDMFFDSGGHISPAVTSETQLWKLPGNVSNEAASGLVLLQVGYNCGIRPMLSPGDCAVVIGDGLVGHWAAQTLAWRGARIALVGRHDERLSKFRFRPGDLSINERRESMTARIEEWAGRDIQVVVDTVGSLRACESLYPFMRHNGHVVAAGYYGHEDGLHLPSLRARELTLHTPAGWSRDRMEQALALLAEGVLNAESLITHRFRVEQAAEAYQLILARREPVLGVVLEWD